MAVVALFFLALNTVVSLYLIFKRRSEFIAYAVLFQEIQILIFNELGLVTYREIYYLLLVGLYAMVNFTREYRHSKVSFTLTRWATWAVIVFAIILFYHRTIVGIPTDQGNEIYERYIFQLIPVLIFISIFISTEKTILKLGDGIILYGMIFVIAIFIIGDFQYFETDRERKIFRDNFGVNPIRITRSSGIVLIVALLYAFYDPRKNRKQIYSICAMFALFMMLFAGARGPILSLAITFAIYYLLSSKRSVQFAVNGFVLVLALVGVYLMLEFGDFGVLDRFERLADYESMPRYERLIIGLGMLQSSDVWLYGLGPDGFNAITGLNYIHNLFFEMLLEYGLLGLSLIGIVTGYGLRLSFKLMIGKYPYQFKVFGPIWVFYFLSTMVSSNVIGNRNLFFLTFIMMSIDYALIKNKSARRYEERMSNF